MSYEIKLTVDQSSSDLFAKHLDYSNNQFPNETQEQFIGRKLIDYMTLVINRPLAEAAYSATLTVPLAVPIAMSIATISGIQDQPVAP